MKRKTVIKGLVVAFSIVCLLVLSGMIASPELYSEEQTVSTMAHARPVPDERPADRRMEMVVPAMADLMDQTGTIVLHVREKDFEKAEEDLARYIEASRSFNNLVISLDMSESDIREFAEGNMENMDALATLIEKSKRMDELSRLEVVYQDGEDSENLYSISYEGEALQMKMEEALTRYQDRQTTMTEIGTKYDLPVSSYIHSVSGFAGVVNETDRTRQAWNVGHDDDQPASGILVSPHSASYGDIVQVSGMIPMTSAGTVSLYLDGKEWTSATTDHAGRYAAAIPASSLSAGRHLIYAVHDGVYSDVTEFEVLAAPAALTLEAEPIVSRGEENVLCRGTLLCEGKAVEGAQITITSDDGISLMAETDRDGAYSCTGRLAAGPRQLRATVSEDLLPLQPTASESVGVEVPEPSTWVTVLAMKTAAVLLVGIGVALAVRHRRARRRSRHLIVVPRRAEIPPGEEWTGIAPDAASPPVEWTPSAVEEQYAALLSSGRYGDAVRLLYLAIAARIGHALKIRNYTTLTPREVLGIAGATTTPSAPSALSKFILSYERVRYGRPAPSHEQTRYLRQLYDHASDQGGDEH